MLSIKGLEKTSEVFGTVELRLELKPSIGIVNDWNFNSDGQRLDSTSGIRFLRASFHKTHAEAVFSWDTRKYENGTRTLTATAAGLTSSIQIACNNLQPAYRVANKKLLGSNIISIDGGQVEMELTEEIAHFLNKLPPGTGYVDQEAGANDRFTVPLNGVSLIIGDKNIERQLDLSIYRKMTFGDTIQIELTDSAAEILMKEFLIDPQIRIGLIGSNTIVSKSVSIMKPKKFPFTHTRIIEGE